MTPGAGKPEPDNRAHPENLGIYFELAPVLMLGLDRDGCVTVINPLGCKILGYPAEEIIGRNWFDVFLPQDNIAEIKEVFRRSVIQDIGLVEYFENEVVCKDGSRRLISWHNGLDRDASGQVREVVCAGVDITEKRALAQDLNQALDEVKTLRGILPICSYCKKIRNDKGFWDQVETYIARHSEAEFSHGICPDCLRTEFPDI